MPKAISPSSIAIVSVPAGRGEARRPGGIDHRDTEQLRKARDIFVPNLHIDTLAVKARNFR